MWSETSPFLNGVNEPLTNEYVIPEARVIGQIPRELNGALFRNGSNQHFHPLNPNKHHWFDGDGMVHAFYLSNGRASYRNKWVRTEGFVAETKAGRALYNGLYGQTDTPQPALPGEAPKIKMVANVNVIALANHVYAVQEASSSWYELVPETLETLGHFDFGGEVKAALTAHPHVDPRNGDMLFYVNDADHQQLECCRATRDGKFVQRHTVRLDAPAWIHDFIFTEDYFIFFLGPLGLQNMARTAPLGRTAWLFQPELGSRILLVNRRDGRAQWFQDVSYQTNHYLNAYQEGTRVVVDGTIAEVSAKAPDVPVSAFFPFPSTGATPNPFSPPQLWRWTLDPAAGTVRHERIGEFSGEFVRPNEAYLGRKHRFGYLAARHAAKSAMPGFNCLVKHDYQTGRSEFQHLSATADVSPSEPIYVPRDGAAGEDDGYLLTVWWDPQRNASELTIHAARDFAGEPLARVILDHRVPLGFHGNWIAR
jgi:carotenoid cleavage dioxygenase